MYYYNSILIIYINDHLIIFSIFDLIKNKTNNTQIFKYIRYHSQHNIIKLNLSLNKFYCSPWTTIYLCYNINIYFSMLTTFL